MIEYIHTKPMNTLILNNITSIWYQSFIKIIKISLILLIKTQYNKNPVNVTLY